MANKGQVKHRKMSVTTYVIIIKAKGDTIQISIQWRDLYFLEVGRRQRRSFALEHPALM